jgi:hypothetical protein
MVPVKLGARPCTAPLFDVSPSRFWVNPLITVS